MKKARAFQSLTLFCLLTVLSYNLFADMKLKVRVTNTGQEVFGGRLTHAAFQHEIIALEVHAEFVNSSASDNRKAVFRGTDVNDFAGHWQNREYTMAPGEAVSFTDTLYFRLTEARTVSMTFLAAQKDMANNYVAGEQVRQVEVTFTVDAATAGLPLPEIHADSVSFSYDHSVITYHPGTSVSFAWKPAETGGDVRRIEQNAYRFSLSDPALLHQSVSGLYKAGLDSMRTAEFYGLEDGVTYGYYIKAVYETASDVYTLYSDIVYATQDNRPPFSVIGTEADLDRNHLGRVTWQPVTDQQVNGTGSGVASYLISRALDTGAETVLDTVPASGPFLWNDTTLIQGASYYYRVRAVDRVGNTGGGTVSNAVLWDQGDDRPEDGEGDIEALSGQADPVYFRGTVDTLSGRLYGWERAVRFVAVREDTSYFSDPPASRMVRFDSGWMLPADAPVHPDDPDSRIWLADYAYNRAADTAVDLNFVDNRLYHRRIYRRDASGSVSYEDLGSRRPDCLSPADIRNLQVHAELEDGGEYRSWQNRLNWDETGDGASGVKRYRVYRKISGLDPDFQEIGTTADITRNIFFDDEFPAAGFLANADFIYKVTAEDFTGNVRSLADAGWEAAEAALAAPGIQFAGAPASMDTLFTAGQTAEILLTNFRHQPAAAFVISVNGIETEYSKSAAVPAGDRAVTINVPLDPVRLSRIRARVIYAGSRSSVWSDYKTVSLRNIPPSGLTAAAMPSSCNEWDGHIYLQWLRGSLDNRRYEVWRSEDGLAWAPVDTLVRCDLDTVRWTDQYGIDELTGTGGDTLTAYRQYHYKVRMVTVSGDTSAFSDPMSAFCTKPPEIVSDAQDTLNGMPAIRISWQRSQPSDAVGSWRTRVYVYLDTEDNLIDSTGAAPLHDVIDNTAFVYPYDAESGTDHNYIFRLYEEVANPAVPGTLLKSSVSRPRTVQLVSLDSLFVIAQPGGKVYLDWGADPLSSSLPVTAYRIERFIDDMPDAVYIVGSSVKGYMDQAGLVHGQTYTYTVAALNYLGQVQASGRRTVICDFGRAFIPDTPELETRYFRPRTIDVGWGWYDLQGNPVSGSTMGAQELRIQTSASRDFPEAYTNDTGWFAADTVNYSRTADIPPVIDNNNERVFIRMTARDRWGHPEEIIWSETVYAIFDTLRPAAVTGTEVTSVTSFYRQPDMVNISLAWQDQSVVNDIQFPANANVARYEVIRRRNNTEWVAGHTDVIPGNTGYAFTDTLTNGTCTWRVISIDSAGNRTEGRWLQFSGYTPTPDPPVPDSAKSCSWEPVAPADSMEYFVEMAAGLRHFSWAYELDIDDPDNNLLCRSNRWLQAVSFSCTSGWGSIAADTTWFRVKARHVRTLVESGWSVPSYRLNLHDNGSEGGRQDSETANPESFVVYQNYPNPFNAGTVIAYDLPEQAAVDIHIYNLQGRKISSILSAEQGPGRYRVEWQGTDAYGNAAASGIYLGVLTVKTESGRTYERRLKMSVVK